MGWLRRHPREILTAFLLLLLNGALAYFSVVMHPLPKGTPGEFWDSMYRLKLGNRDYFGGVYPTRDDWCIYRGLVNAWALYDNSGSLPILISSGDND